MSHRLDRPIWAALTSRQVGFDPTGVRARRFPADVSPLAAAQDASPAALAALIGVIAPGDEVSLVEVAPPTPPPDIEVSHSQLVQMVMTDGFKAGGRDQPMIPLGDGDVTEMLALATLTRPGPFRARTHTLGRFVGIRERGVLVAMAGERMHVDGFHEISAVCTHPDHRGRGYGAALMRAVGERILAEGATPFLHSYAANTGAIALYTHLGFSIRTEVTHAIWRKRAAQTKFAAQTPLSAPSSTGFQSAAGRFQR